MHLWHLIIVKDTVEFCICIFLNYIGQQIKKKFVSVMNMLLIYLFPSMKLEKGHKEITWL